MAVLDLYGCTFIGESYFVGVLCDHHGEAGSWMRSRRCIQRDTGLGGDLLSPSLAFAPLAGCVDVVHQSLLVHPKAGEVPV